MEFIRKSLILSLSSLIFASCSINLANCNRFANYTKTKFILEIDRPKCETLKKRLNKYEQEERNLIFKYFKYISGEEGIEQAYRECINNYCE